MGSWFTEPGFIVLQIFAQFLDSLYTLHVLLPSLPSWETRSDCELMEDWPSSHDIDVLCEKAAGIFIHVSTVIKFVVSKYHTPTKRLDLVISLPQSTTCEEKSGIDLLYTQVLEQAFCDADSDEQDLYSHFRSVVRAVLLVFNPLLMETLSTLLRISDILVALCSLHSVLLLPTDTVSGPLCPSLSQVTLDGLGVPKSGNQQYCIDRTSLWPYKQLEMTTKWKTHYQPQRGVWTLLGFNRMVLREIGEKGCLHLLYRSWWLCLWTWPRDCRGRLR